MTNLEYQRYGRHLTLSEVGIDGQNRLKNAKVICIGAGGLASPALLYLAATGVGTIGIVEDDQIELSNLQRQILYSDHHVGNKKAVTARNRLIELNPTIKVDVFSERITRDNALEILSPYDIVIDCTDNFYSRFLINDACFYLNKPDIYASILRFDGQCSVFSNPHGPCYRCLFPSPPSPASIPSCSEAGVIGALPGIIGSIQAMEAIKLILQKGAPLIGRLLTIDALTMQFRELKISRNPDCPLCVHQIPFHELELPTLQCEISNTLVKEISVHDFHRMRQKNESFLLLDVREPFEFEICNLGGHLIPLNQLSLRLNELDPNQHIVIHCKSGARSQKAFHILDAHGFSNVSHIKGGILAWINEIDPAMLCY